MSYSTQAASCIAEAAKFAQTCQADEVTELHLLWALFHLPNTYCSTIPQERYPNAIAKIRHVITDWCVEQAGGAGVVSRTEDVVTPMSVPLQEALKIGWQSGRDTDSAALLFLLASTRATSSSVLNVLHQVGIHDLEELRLVHPSSPEPRPVSYHARTAISPTSNRTGRRP